MTSELVMGGGGTDTRASGAGYHVSSSIPLFLLYSTAALMHIRCTCIFLYLVHGTAASCTHVLPECSIMLVISRPILHQYTTHYIDTGPMTNGEVQPEVISQTRDPRPKTRDPRPLTLDLRP